VFIDEAIFSKSLAVRKVCGPKGAVAPCVSEKIANFKCVAAVSAIELEGKIVATHVA
jgi:hypothetical protein